MVRSTEAIGVVEENKQPPQSGAVMKTTLLRADEIDDLKRYRSDYDGFVGFLRER